MQKAGTIIQLILLVIALAALLAFALTHNRRANARAEADRIISGERSATEEQIHEIIRRFMAGEPWVLDMTTQDGRRLKRLLDIRDEIRKSRSHKFRTNIRARADQIISGEQQNWEGYIDLIICDFQVTTQFAQREIDQDRRLLEQLLDIRDEMRKSHGLPPWAPFDPNSFEVQQKSSGKSR